MACCVLQHKLVSAHVLYALQGPHGSADCCAQSIAGLQFTGPNNGACCFTPLAQLGCLRLSLQGCAAAVFFHHLPRLLYLLQSILVHPSIVRSLLRLLTAAVHVYCTTQLGYKALHCNAVRARHSSLCRS